VSDTEQSFAGAPLSIGEIRSARSESGADWTPREALICALRALDRDEIKPASLVIAWEGKDDKDKSVCDYFSACPDVLRAIAVLARVSYRLNFNADPE